MFNFIVAVNYREGYENVIMFGRWLGICRIYRIYTFFRQVNETVNTNYLSQQIFAQQGDKND